jgi:hypothetical protein
MKQMLLVGVGGAIGSVARYLAGIAIIRVTGAAFPFNTLSVNGPAADVCHAHTSLANSESMPPRPILAKIPVRAAKHAESTAQTNQVGVSVSAMIEVQLSV